MNKGLQIVNASILALNVTFALTLGVVTLIYSFYLDAAPRIREEWSMVGLMTAIFTVLSLTSYAGFFGLWRQKSWRWPAQGLMWASLLLGGALLLRILRN